MGIENLIFEILLPNSKQIFVGTIHCQPNQTNFLAIFHENLSKVDTNNIKMYIVKVFKT